MTTLDINHLRISWAVSRGRDTYGYNICRLDSRKTGRRYRCSGGGYDMIGTVFGDCLAAEYQQELQALIKARGSDLVECGYQVRGYKKLPDLYGLVVHPKGMVTLDGACGVESMRRIAEAIGLDVQWQGNRKGHTIGYFLSREVQ